MAITNGDGPVVWGADRFRASREEWELVRLPISGGVVRVSSIGAPDLALRGHLPEALTDHIFHDTSELEARQSTDAERRRVALERTEAINAVVCAFVVEPRLTTGQVAGDELHITELPWGDRVRLFTIALGQADPGGGLARFPVEQASGVPSTPDGAGLRDEAELAPGAAGE